MLVRCCSVSLILSVHRLLHPLAQSSGGGRTLCFAAKLAIFSTSGRARLRGLSGPVSLPSCPGKSVSPGALVTTVPGDADEGMGDGGEVSGSASGMSPNKGENKGVRSESIVASECDTMPKLSDMTLPKLVTPDVCSSSTSGVDETTTFVSMDGFSTMCPEGVSADPEGGSSLGVEGVPVDLDCGSSLVPECVSLDPDVSSLGPEGVSAELELISLVPESVSLGPSAASLGLEGVSLGPEDVSVVSQAASLGLEGVSLGPEVASLSPEGVSLGPEVASLGPGGVSMGPGSVSMGPECASLGAEGVSLSPDSFSLKQLDTALRISPLLS